MLDPCSGKKIFVGGMEQILMPRHSSITGIAWLRPFGCGDDSPVPHLHDQELEHARFAIMLLFA